MANGDVKLTATGLPGGTPTGVSITYRIDAVPSALIDLAPGDAGLVKISEGSAGFGDIDAKKRVQDVDINISVSSYAGDKGKIKKTLRFSGLFDGLSITNMVGGNTYQAVVKNKAQVLAELTTLTPGVYPTSINIFRNPNFGISKNKSDFSARLWRKFEAESLKISKGPIEFYKNILLKVLTLQQGTWKDFIGTEKLPSGDNPFDKIFEDQRYKKSVEIGKALLSDMDTSAVSSGPVSNSCNHTQIISAISKMFTNSPNILLDNLRAFLSYMGCTLIFSNSKMYVVPINSMLKQPTNTPDYRQLQNSPNHANPANYNSYVYNDTGYRDIGMVMVTLEGQTLGASVGNLSSDRGNLIHFAAPKELSNSCGILVVKAHPWMTLSAAAPTGAVAPEARTRADDKQDSLTDDSYSSFDSHLSKLASKRASDDESRTTKANEYLKTILENYAETKFYQERYNDRYGTITMDFNPDWVPGTGGTLYIRETAMFVAFYVNSVTHRVDMHAPSSGTAMTVVNFSCGRMGKDPHGADDLYLGYNIGKEQAIQKAFISDNT